MFINCYNAKTVEGHRGPTFIRTLDAFSTLTASRTHCDDAGFVGIGT